MKFAVKKGNTVIERNNISKDLIIKAMNEVLEEHDHLCKSCGSEACQGKRDLEQELISKAVQTNDRVFVFDCFGYKPKLNHFDYALLNDEEEMESYESEYIPFQHKLSNPKVLEYIRKRW